MNSPTTSISIYKNIHDTKSRDTVHLDIFLEAVRSGKWQDQVLKIRTIKEHDARQQAKKTLPYVTISGIFNDGRNNNGLSCHSGFISMDLDNLGSDVEGIRTLLSADPYVYSAFTSVSGTGLCVLFKIDPEKHREAFDSIADYLIRQYQLIIDPSGKDVSRPRYVSYDPDLHLNADALRFKKYLPKPKPRKIQATIFVQTEFDDMISQMVINSVSCVEDYRDWVGIGFALADKFGEAGRPYFHQLSSCSAKYETSMCDRQYTHCLRHAATDRKITIATIYWFAKSAGINTTSQQTKKVAAATSTLKKGGLDAAAIAKNLKQFEGIEGVDDIIKQAFAANQSFAGGETMVENIRMWIRHNYTLSRNVITRKLENNGQVLDEIDLNTMFLDCKVVFEDATFDLFCKILFSGNTAQHNPLLEWFESRKDNPVKEGTIEAFFACFDTADDIYYFGKKWMVSAISTLYGVHSPLMLIFAGQKQGTGKTEAFRRMLPKELRTYYAESKLDAGKDDEILMTQKWIIMDDEMGGKSKKESKRLKELTSKDTFTLREPYGRMNVDLKRLALLCGTTNDLEILNDPTGNRRLLPMEINGIDITAYNAINKDDLWMEAWHLYKDGYVWALNSEDVERLAGKADKFEETCPEREVVERFFIQSAHNFLTATMLKNQMEILTVQKFNLRRIGMELKRLGYPRIKQYGIYGYMIEHVSAHGVPSLDVSGPPF